MSEHEHEQGFAGDEPTFTDELVVYTRPRLQVQPAIADEGDGQRLAGFWLTAIEADDDGNRLEGTPEVRIPMSPEHFRLMAAAGLDFLERLTAVTPEEGPKNSELIIAPSSALAHLGRSERRRLERSQRGQG